MRYLLALALALTLLLGWAPPADPLDAAALARWAGLGPEVQFVFRVDADDDAVNGYFQPGGYVCSPFECGPVQPKVAVIAGRNVPEAIVLYVLFHEVAHYLQWREWGEAMFAMDPVALEWDADVRAVEMMCARHDDGLGAISAARDWLYTHYQYEGDVLHGTMAERVANALARATACRQRAEAP